MENIILTTNDELRQIFTELLDERFNQLKGIESAPTQKEIFLRINEVAQMFKVTRQTIHYWTKNGILPFIKINNSVFFDKQQVIDLMKRQDKYKDYAK